MAHADSYLPHVEGQARMINQQANLYQLGKLFYHSLYHYEKAEAIFRQILLHQQEMLGEIHPDTIKTKAALVAVYNKELKLQHACGRAQEKSNEPTG